LWHFFVLTGIGLIAAALGVFTQWVIAKKEKIAAELKAKTRETQELQIEERKVQLQKKREGQDTQQFPKEEIKERVPTRREQCHAFFTSGASTAVYFFYLTYFWE